MIEMSSAMMISKLGEAEKSQTIVASGAPRKRGHDQDHHFGVSALPAAALFYVTVGVVIPSFGSRTSAANSRFRGRTCASFSL